MLGIQASLLQGRGRGLQRRLQFKQSLRLFHLGLRTELLGSLQRGLQFLDPREMQRRLIRLRLQRIDVCLELRLFGARASTPLGIGRAGGIQLGDPCLQR